MPDPDFHLSIEETSRSQLAEPRRGPSRAALIVLSALIAIPVLALPFLLNQPRPSDNLESGVEEELLQAPSHVKLELPSAVQEAPAGTDLAPRTTDANSEALAEAERARRQAETDAEDARRTAEAERLARESENDERKWERYRSPMVVTEAGQSADMMAQEDQAKPPAEGEKSAGTFQDTNPNGQFLSAMAAKPVEIAKAEQNKRIDALVPQGTMIRGVLETAVQTDLPGMVRAVTTEDVWSFDGRRVLLPSGTRMIGEYNAGIAQGQTRAFIVWNRVLRADGVSLNLGSIGTDELGRSGSGGDVNNHYLKRFGAAGVLSLISAGTQIIAASGSRQTIGGTRISSIPDPNRPGQYITITAPTDSGIKGSDLAMQGAALAVQNFTQLAQEALKAQLNIQPTITINQGTPVAIFVRRDLDFSELYPDPVKEKLKELKQGRGWDGK